MENKTSREKEPPISIEEYAQLEAAAAATASAGDGRVRVRILDRLLALFGYRRNAATLSGLAIHLVEKGYLAKPCWMDRSTPTVAAFCTDDLISALERLESEACNSPF